MNASIHDFGPDVRSLRQRGVGDFRLEGKVRAVLGAAAPAGWTATGIGREYYLDVMERIVRGAGAWVTAEGRVIDPVVGKETGQVSPRFASSAAILLQFGRLPGIADAAFRSMDYCCRAMATGGATSQAPDFWTRELVTAYMALGGVAEESRRARWAADLSAFEPEQLYTAVRPDGAGLESLGNWAVYSGGGEAMREAAGLRPDRDMLWGNAFFEKYVGGQFGVWTADGMYRDPGDPVTYDITTRLQVASALAFGYGGTLRGELEELLRRGALTTLMFMSPEGYVPYGGRSAAFHFREAIVSALCELEARRYREADPLLAGAFKRQAHLSALAIRRWVMDMEPWRHIENGFPPEALHGTDGYGNYAVYSLLISSFLGLAALFADDVIPERPCPAEIGGFALVLEPAFHKAFANVGGTYMELDLGADPHYDATGLGRFCRKGVPLELGAAMAFPVRSEKWGGVAIRMAPGAQPPPLPMAIGPELWIDGAWWSAAAGMDGGGACRFRTQSEAADVVIGEVTQDAPGGRRLTQRYELRCGGVLGIDCRLHAGRGRAEGDRLRFVVPLLASNGMASSSITVVGAGDVRVDYLGHRVQVRFDPGCEVVLDAAGHANRHGIYRRLQIESRSDRVAVELSLA